MTFNSVEFFLNKYIDSLTN